MQVAMDRTHARLRTIPTSRADGRMTADLIERAVRQPCVVAFGLEGMAQRMENQPPVVRNVAIDEAIDFLACLLCALADAVLLEVGK